MASLPAQLLVDLLLVRDFLGRGWLNLIAVASLLGCDRGDGNLSPIADEATFVLDVVLCTTPRAKRVIDTCVDLIGRTLGHEHAWDVELILQLLALDVQTPRGPA